MLASLSSFPLTASTPDRIHFVLLSFLFYFYDLLSEITDGQSRSTNIR